MKIQLADAENCAENGFQYFIKTTWLQHMSLRKKVSDLPAEEKQLWKMNAENSNQ